MPQTPQTVEHPQRGDSSGPLGAGEPFGLLCNRAGGFLQRLLTTRNRKRRSRPGRGSGIAPGPPTRFCWAPVGRKSVSPSATFLWIRQPPRSNPTTQQRKLSAPLALRRPTKGPHHAPSPVKPAETNVRSALELLHFKARFEGSSVWLSLDVSLYFHLASPGGAAVVNAHVLCGCRHGALPGTTKCLARTYHLPGSLGKSRSFRLRITSHDGSPTGTYTGTSLKLKLLKLYKKENLNGVVFN